MALRDLAGPNFFASHADILLGDHVLATVDSYDYTKNTSLIAQIKHLPDGQGVLTHSYQLSIGNQKLLGAGGNDTLSGGLGDDIVFAGGKDVILGQNGGDNFIGNAAKVSGCVQLLAQHLA